MRIQEGLQNFYQGTVNVLSKIGSGIKSGFLYTVHGVKSFAVKTYAYAQPALQKIGAWFSDKFALLATWFKNNKDKVLVSAITAAVIVVSYAIYKAVCCKGDAAKKAVPAGVKP